MCKQIIKYILCSIILLNIVNSLNICQRSEKWTLSSKTFPYDFPGKVKLVAFLKASCNFCRKQATNLGNLQEELIKENYNDVQLIIVNSLDQDCINRTSVFKSLTNVLVLQDIPKINVWALNNASIDDMILFDRCNRMVSHLSMPESFVHTGSVKKAILEAYKQETCGNSCRVPLRKNKIIKPNYS